MSNKAVSAAYRHIIDDVIANVRQDFEDMGIEREILEELQRSWETKIIATCVAEFDGASSSTDASTSATGKGAARGKGKDKEIKPNVKHQAIKAERSAASAAANGNGASAAASSSATPLGSDAGPSSSQTLMSQDSRKAIRTDAGRVDRDSKTDGQALYDGKSEPSEEDKRAGEKRKRAEATDEITSDLDDSDEEPDEPGEVEGEDMVLCLYDKVQRVKNKWKCVLKDGIASIDGRDYVFSKLTSDFEW